MSGLKGAVDRIDAVQQRHRAPAVAVAVAKKYADDGGPRLAAAIAFYGFFSVFPLMLVLVSVLGFALRGNEDLRRRILDTALEQFPVVGRDIEENTGAARGNAIGVVVGVLGALWAGTGAFASLHYSLDQVWGVPRAGRGNLLRHRLRAMAGVGLVGAGLLGLTIVTTILSGIHGQFGLPGRVLLQFATTAVFAALFAAVFRYGTTASVSWREVRPGAVVAAVGWVILGALGSLYINRVINGASDTYGVFAVVIGLLSWLLLLAQLVLGAAELNVVLARRLWPRGLRERARDDAADAAGDKVERTTVPPPRSLA